MKNSSKQILLGCRETPSLTVSLTRLIGIRASAAAGGTAPSGKFFSALVLERATGHANGPLNSAQPNVYQD